MTDILRRTNVENRSNFGKKGGMYTQQQISDLKQGIVKFADKNGVIRFDKILNHYNSFHNCGRTEKGLKDKYYHLLKTNRISQPNSKKPRNKRRNKRHLTRSQTKGILEPRKKKRKLNTSSENYYHQNSQIRRTLGAHRASGKRYRPYTEGQMKLLTQFIHKPVVTSKELDELLSNKEFIGSERTIGGLKAKIKVMQEKNDIYLAKTLVSVKNSEMSGDNSDISNVNDEEFCDESEEEKKRIDEIFGIGGSEENRSVFSESGIDSNSNNRNVETVINTPLGVYRFKNITGYLPFELVTSKSLQGKHIVKMRMQRQQNDKLQIKYAKTRFNSFRIIGNFKQNDPQKKNETPEVKQNENTVSKVQTFTSEFKTLYKSKSFLDEVELEMTVPVTLGHITLKSLQENIKKNPETKKDVISVLDFKEIEFNIEDIVEV